MGSVKSGVEGGYELVGGEQWVIAEGMWRIEEAHGSDKVTRGVRWGREERERHLGTSPELLMPTAILLVQHLLTSGEDSCKYLLINLLPPSAHYPSKL